MSSCSLRDFYRVKEVFQRNNFCNVTGVLLEVKDTDLASNYLVSNKLRPTNGGPPQPINSDEAGDKGENDEEFEDKQCTYVLRLSAFTPPAHSHTFYQRALPADNKITHCSVSDSYVVYAVVQESAQFVLQNRGEFDSLEMVEAELAKRTLLVIVDIKNKTEVVLPNPSQKKVTAVYVDETILMVGSYSEVYQLTPQSLFIQDEASNLLDDKHDEAQGKFTKTMLPEAQRQNNEIYAFWHTQSSAKIDVYAKSNTKAQISIYLYRTAKAMEKIRLQRRRKTMLHSAVGDS